MGCKLINKLMCQVVKPENQKVPIYKFDKTLAEKTVLEMNKLAQLTYADPCGGSSSHDSW